MQPVWINPQWRVNAFMLSCSVSLFLLPIAQAKDEQKGLRFAQLLGKDRAEVTNILKARTKVAEVWNFDFTRSYGEGKAVSDDTVETLALVFKYDRVSLVKDDIFYSKKRKHVRTKWFDANGVVNPQPHLPLRDERILSRIVGGAEVWEK